MPVRCYICGVAGEDICLQCLRVSTLRRDAATAGSWRASKVSTLLERAGLKTEMRGHVGDGCISTHVDLRGMGETSGMRSYIDALLRLVTRQVCACLGRSKGLPYGTGIMRPLLPSGACSLV